MNKPNFKVRAASGLKVPLETKPRKYITDAADVTVPATAYYLRRMSSGELLDQDEIKAAAAPVTEPGKSKTSKGA